MRKQNVNTGLAMEDFFHDRSEAALHKQVAWLKRNLGFRNTFFSHLLNIDETAFTRWMNRQDKLATTQLDTLQAFWVLHLRILALFDFDLSKVRQAYTNVDQSLNTAYGNVPPWKGTSLEAFIERRGTRAIKEAGAWLHRLRFAEAY